MTQSKILLLAIVLVSCDRGPDDPVPDDKNPNNPPTPTVQSDMHGLTMAAVPPGSMIAFAGPMAPQGWWLCDGRAISRDEYPDLFKAIGSSWGDGGDGDGPLFNIPDMRGLFPRGVDAGAKRDPEAASRKPLTQGGNTGDRVGSLQEAATAPPANPFVINMYSGTLGVREGNNISWDLVKYLRDTTVQMKGGDAETRPRNVAVNWIVKY